MNGDAPNAQLLDAVRNAQTNFILEADTRTAFGGLLDELLAITDSEYGFIGEVERSNGTPALRVRAYTDISWNDETRRLIQASASTGLLFEKMDTLFGFAITNEQVVISNDPDSDPRSGGLPPGHPPLRAFLGLPFYFGKELIGLIGLANCPRGYKESDVKFLEPLVTTCGTLSYSRTMAATKNRNRQLQEQAERTKGLIEFSQKLAHDLNNLLSVIQTTIDTSRVSDNESLTSEEMDTIYLSARRATDLTKRILSCAGSKAINREPVSLPMIVQEVLAICEAIVPSNIEFGADVAAGLPFVLADSSALQQSLVNIVFNSIEAIGHRQGKVSIQAHSEEDGTVCISVCDNGPGMNEAIQRRAFDPYFTTKGGDRGFGLANVMGFVHSHSGVLNLDSAADEGTTISIVLPTTKASPNEKAGDGDFSFANRRILLVDDEPVVLETVRRLLERLGATVFSFSSGAEALDTLERIADISAIFLDVTMPGMDGFELSRRIRSGSATRHHSVPILFLSGHSNRSLPEEFVNDSSMTFLKKPFTIEELEQTCMAIF